MSGIWKTSVERNMKDQGYNRGHMSKVFSIVNVKVLFKAKYHSQSNITLDYNVNIFLFSFLAG